MTKHTLTLKLINTTIGTVAAREGKSFEPYTRAFMQVLPNRFYPGRTFRKILVTGSSADPLRYYSVRKGAAHALHVDDICTITPEAFEELLSRKSRPEGT